MVGNRDRDVENYFHFLKQLRWLGAAIINVVVTRLTTSESRLPFFGIAAEPHVRINKVNLRRGYKTSRRIRR